MIDSMDTLKYIAKKYRLKLEGQFPIELTKVGRNDLAKLFAELGFSKGVELGTWQGNYSAALCDANPQLQLFGIDLNSKTPRKAVPNNCRLIRMGSLDAAKRFVDASLDFVYLDGDHDLAATTNDLQEWVKKVRSGGIIAGHDYFRYRHTAQVRAYEAVIAYTGAYRIAPWFVIGREVDPVRSWFWVKR